VAALVMVLAGGLTLAFHRHLPLVKEFRSENLPLMAHWDSLSYYSMATGKYADVLSPFSKRALYPWLAATVSEKGHVDIATAFVSLNLVAFATLAWCIAAMLEITIRKPWLVLLLLLTPMPLESLELGYLPDLFHTALTALFFLLLLKERVIPALGVLLVCFATRESTLLLCLATAFLGFRHRRRTLWMGSLAVLVAGTMITNAVARLGKPNIHHMPDALYLALKVPFNFLLNFLGLTIWSDLNHMGNPFVKWQVPAFLHRLVADREIGLDWDWRAPIKTLIVYLTVFGTAPVWLASFRKRWRFLLLSRPEAPTSATAGNPAFPLAIQLACVYGVLCYLVGPALGNWIERLVGYGWPAFWIALPWLLYRHPPKLDRGAAALLAGNFLVVAWWPSLFGWAPDTNYALCAVGLLLYLPTVLTLRRLASTWPPAE
jgi:hypothetical protein